MKDFTLDNLPQSIADSLSSSINLNGYASLVVCGGSSPLPIYDNLSNIYITDDGEVFLGSQEEFENSQGQLELLKIEDYKYQIDEISPSRTEIRLKAKDIKGAYQQDFIKLQESVIFEELSGTVDFGASPNTSTTLNPPLNGAEAPPVVRPSALNSSGLK